MLPVIAEANNIGKRRWIQLASAKTNAVRIASKFVNLSEQHIYHTVVPRHDGG